MNKLGKLEKVNLRDIWANDCLLYTSDAADD